MSYWLQMSSVPSRESWPYLPFELYQSDWTKWVMRARDCWVTIHWDIPVYYQRFEPVSYFTTCVNCLTWHQVVLSAEVWWMANVNNAILYAFTFFWPYCLWTQHIHLLLKFHVTLHASDKVDCRQTLNCHRILSLFMLFVWSFCIYIFTVVSFTYWPLKM